MGHENLKYIKDNLMRSIEYQMCHLPEVDAEELGCAIDMLKDLEEALYYCTITEAMEGKGKGNEYEFEFNGKNEHQQQQRHDTMYNNGRGNGNGNGGTRSYMDEYPMMYSMPRMYEDNMYGNSNRNGRGSNGGSRSNLDEPLQMMMRDYREGRSPDSRRMYMESRENGHDKAAQLRELEKYMQELSQDVVEMIQESTPEEKQYLEKKLAALSSKVGQMK